MLKTYSDISIIGQTSNSETIADVFHVNHVRFIFYNKNSLISGIFNYIKCVRSIAKNYKQINIDIIFVGALYPSLPILFISKKIRTFIWLRSFFEYEINELSIKKIRPLAMLLEKNCLYRANKIIANGEDTKILYEQKYKKLKDIVVIPNAIDTKVVKSNQLTLRNDVVKIAYIGRFYKNKGIEEFLDSIKIINKEKTDKRFVFLFVGFGEYEDKVKSLEKTYSNVKLIGRVNNTQIFDFLSTIDCTVNLTFSRKDTGGSGVSNSLLESIFANNLPIAWKNFCYEQILNDNNAVLITEGNSSELSQAYDAIYENRNIYLNKINKLITLKDNYCFSKHIEKLLEVL